MCIRDRREGGGGGEGGEESSSSFQSLLVPGNNVYHYAGSLYVDHESTFDGERKPVTRTSEEVGM